MSRSRSLGAGSAEPQILLTMNEDKRKEVVLETIDRINESLQSDSNALLTKTNDNNCNPEAAYCELIQNILKLID